MAALGIKAAKAAKGLLLVLICLFTAGCTKETSKNVCPIDGQPPQWTGARHGDTCEYGHYSIIEKSTHSWWAPCIPNRQR
jgi:hypothetical protein